MTERRSVHISTGFFKDAQVEPRYPAYDPESDPQLGDGVWRPWIKSEDELGDLSEEDRQAYLQAAEDKFNHVDESERRKLNLAKESASLKVKQDEEKLACKTSKFSYLG